MPIITQRETYERSVVALAVGRDLRSCLGMGYAEPAPNCRPHKLLCIDRDGLAHHTYVYFLSPTA